MNRELIDFIKNHSRDIDNGDFATIYALIDTDYYGQWIYRNCGKFTEALLNAGIDPLENSKLLFNNYLARASLDNFNIPDHIEKLGNACFFSATIPSIIIPPTIIELPSECFADGEFESIELPKTITYIAYDAFADTTVNEVRIYKNSYADRWLQEYEELHLVYFEE